MTSAQGQSSSGLSESHDARRAKRSGTVPTASMGPGLSLGRVFGVQIRAHWSLLLIIALITFNLGGAFLAALHPHWGPGLRWAVALSAAVLFFVSILLHELSHALVGRALGVSIQSITLFMFGGMAHVEREPDRPSSEFWMALAGPLASILIGIVAIALGVQLSGAVGSATTSDELLVAMQQLTPLGTLLLWLGPVNLILALFNMLPGFPLDGGRVLRALLWWLTRDLVRATRWASLIGQLVAWTLIAAGVSMIFGFTIPLLGRGAVQGLWLVLIGWFLSNAAQAAYQRVLFDLAVKGLPVRQLMDTHVETVPPNLSVGSLLHERLLHTEQRCFPVAQNGRLEGLICLEDIRRVARSEWDTVPVSSIMTPAAQLLALKPDDEASRAVEMLAERDVDQIPVVDGGELRGLVRRRDGVRWAAVQQGSA